MKIWKDVIGFEDLFMVSSCGSIYSKRTKRELKQFLHKNGYYQCVTKVGGRCGKNICLKIHQQVAKSFVDGQFEGAVVNHIDGDKTNNNFCNLEWCTPKENSQHYYRNLKK